MNFAKTRKLVIAKKYCVYFLRLGRALVYVGSTGGLLQRVISHRSNGVKFDRINYIPCETCEESLQREREYIRLLKPPGNKQLYNVRVKTPRLPAKNLVRVNMTIDPALHSRALVRVKELGLPDGFSGLVSRLITLDLRRAQQREEKAALILSQS